MRAIKWLILIFVWLILFLSIAVTWSLLNLPETESIQISRQPSITFLDKQGRIIASYGDIYGQSITSSPREPFPPPIELKRHIPKQPLPLILHDPGTGYKTPHFDIPASILDPKAYMKSLKNSLP